MFRLLTALSLTVLPLTAEAGAWLREKGEVQIILQHEDYRVDRYRDTYSKIYVEYGLFDKATVVAEISESRYFDKQQALLLLRTPIGKGTGPHKFSIETGGGIAREAGIDMTLVRGTLAWGRGIDNDLFSGWANAEATVEQIGLDVNYKADLTLGIDLRPDIKLILQLQNGESAEFGTYSRFTPSMTYEIRPGTYLELGLRQGLYGEDSQGLKIGTWLRF